MSCRRCAPSSVDLSMRLSGWSWKIITSLFRKVRKACWSRFFKTALARLAVLMTFQWVSNDGRVKHQNLIVWTLFCKVGGTQRVKLSSVGWWQRRSPLKWSLSVIVSCIVPQRRRSGNLGLTTRVVRSWVLGFRSLRFSTLLKTLESKDAQAPKP